MFVSGIEVMAQKRFGVGLMVAILKFKMAPIGGAF
jgi:hypothetical protein